MPSIPCVRVIRFNPMACTECKEPHSVSAEIVRNDVAHLIEKYLKTTPLNTTTGGAIAVYSTDVLIVYGYSLTTVVERVLAKLTEQGGSYRDLSTASVPPCDIDKEIANLYEVAKATGQTIAHIPDAGAGDPLMN